MNKFVAPTLSPALLLKLRQAYRSMPELDLALFSILKGFQNSEGISIWLLNEAGIELECTHTVGPHAASMLGDGMRASKFIKAIRSAASKKLTFENTPPTEWLDAKAHQSYFNLPARQLITAPLTARRYNRSRPA